MTRRWTSRWSGPLVAVIVTTLAATLLATAYGYSRSSGLFPIFIGWVFLGLSLIESVLRIRRFLEVDLVMPNDAGTGLESIDASSALRELQGFAWLLLFLLGIYAVGFIPATAMFLFAFLRMAATRSYAYSALAAVVATTVVYGVFAWMLEYRLYAGLLFGG